MTDLLDVEAPGGDVRGHEHVEGAIAEAIHDPVALLLGEAPVEGGGVTVSMFLEANLLDRLQIAIAPLLIGDGRPAIRLPARTALSDCHRPRYRVFRMGTDVLFDCEIGPDGNSAAQPDRQPPITRVI